MTPTHKFTKLLWWITWKNSVHMNTMKVSYNPNSKKVVAFCKMPITTDCNDLQTHFKLNVIEYSKKTR